MILLKLPMNKRIDAFASLHKAYIKPTWSLHDAYIQMADKELSEHKAYMMPTCKWADKGLSEISLSVCKKSS